MANIKFSEVPIGGLFRTEYDDCIKISEYKYVFSDNGNDLIASIYSDSEVELVTKCSNCKYINKNSGELEVPIDGLKHYCHRIRADLSESHYGLDRDIETFSCSFFEMKD